MPTTEKISNIITIQYKMLKETHCSTNNVNLFEEHFQRQQTTQERVSY